MEILRQGQNTPKTPILIRTNRPLSILIVGVIFLMLSQLHQSYGSNIDEYSDKLLKGILAAGEAEERFDALNTSEWTDVCSIDPYHNNYGPYGNMPDELANLPSNFVFYPRRWSIEEEEVGLVFLDKKTLTGRIAKFPRSMIREIKGSRCVPRHLARFTLKHIASPNVVFVRMIILD